MNHNDSKSSFHDLHCCHWTADVEDLVLCRNLKLHIDIDIVYDIVYDIEVLPEGFYPENDGRRCRRDSIAPWVAR